MSVIDETWEAVGTSIVVDGQGPILGRMAFDVPSKPDEANSYAHALDRAKLAAQAPAFARRLLALLKGNQLTPLIRDEVERLLRDAGVFR